MSSWILFSISIYHYYKISIVTKQRILVILISSLIFGTSVCFFETIQYLRIGSTSLSAISQFTIALTIIFMANLIFKYFKIYREKAIKIYECLPFYCKHIPLATILTIIFTTGFFLSNHLVKSSKNTMIKNADMIVADIEETAAILFQKTDQIGESISNSPYAKDAMPSGGKLTINTFVEDSKYILSIADTEIGIRQDNISKIFDPFLQQKRSEREQVSVYQYVTV